MKKSAEILVHVLFWTAFTSLNYILTQVYLQADPEAPFSEHLTYVIMLELIMGLLLFYVTFFGVKWSAGKTSRRIVVAVSVTALTLFFAAPATRVGWLAVMNSLVPHVILILLALVFRRYSDAVRLEEERNELKLKNAETELELLRMQLSPHFLFNTLNNIDYLVAHDAQRASDSISKLGTILRYILYEAGSGKTDLSGELKCLADYIGLLRLRTGSDDFPVYEPPAYIGSYKIAPMILLPLVENAFKHSASGNRGNFRVTVSVSDGMLHFSVSNDYRAGAKATHESGGIGLKNVKRRLDLIYPDRHSFEISEADNIFRVDLKIKLDDNKVYSS